MAETICNVDSGVCGMKSKVIGTMSDDGMKVNIIIESTCPMVKKMSPLEGLDPFQEIGVPMTESAVYTKAAGCIRHTACPVPCAIVKCIEATSGMGLKKPVKIEWE